MKDSGKKRIAILAAGMHRSGTSALTRVLNIVGCDLPRTLMKPQRDNVEGFWESQAIADFNQEVLASSGSSWDDWRPFARDWYASPIADEFRERAQELVHSEFGNSRLFVLKDPRICRLLEFWIEIVRACSAQPFVVSPIRNPFDVASSLHIRNNIDPFVGLLIWLRHVLDAEAASRGLKRAYLRHEQLVSEAHSLVDRLGNDLGVAWPKSSSPLAEMEIDEFLSPELHHHSSDDANHRSNPHLSKWIKTSFAIFDRWSHGNVCEGDISDLDRIKAAFDEATPAFSRAMAAGRKAEQGNRELSKKLEVSRHELEASRRELEASRRELEASRRELEVFQRETAEREDRIRTLSEELEISRMGHVMALAHRGERFGVGKLEVNILLNPEWLDQAKQRCKQVLPLELRRNGRRVAQTLIRDHSHHLVRIPARAHTHSIGDALYSIHDAVTGEVLAALVTPAFRQMRRVVGAVENRKRPEVRGWVLDPSSPERNRRIAIHVDGHLRKVIYADQQRDDIARWKKTVGHHGFLWRFPEDVTLKDETRIDVFDADTGRPLEGSPVRIKEGRAIRSSRHGK